MMQPTGVIIKLCGFIFQSFVHTIIVKFICILVIVPLIRQVQKFVGPSNRPFQSATLFKMLNIHDKTLIINYLIIELLIIFIQMH